MTAVSEWSAVTLARIDERPGHRYDFVPLDRLLGDTCQAAQSLSLGRACYSHLLTASQAASEWVMAGVVFPIAVSATTETQPPPLEELQRWSSDFERLICICADPLSSKR